MNEDDRSTEELHEMEDMCELYEQFRDEINDYDSFEY